MRFYLRNTPKVKFGSLDCTKTALTTYKPYLSQTFRQTFGKPTQTFVRTMQTFQTSKVCKKFGLINCLNLLFITIYRNWYKIDKLLEFVGKLPIKPAQNHIDSDFGGFLKRSKLPNLTFSNPKFLETPLKLFRQIVKKVNPLSELFKRIL